MRGLMIAGMFALGATAAHAQVTETPVPFDSGGRVKTITPALAARLGLMPPTWPVVGVFSEVRLYQRSAGGFVLAAIDENGLIIRHEISAEQRDALALQVTEAMARVGRPATEENSDVISERASGAFMRNQMGLAFSLYGISLATLASDETLSPALYLIAPAATFFIAGGYAKRHPISRAQNELASDGAVRVAAMGAGALFAFGVEDAQAYAATIFAGGLAGTMLGLDMGRGMTDGEAAGATWGSTSLAVTTLGVLGASDALSSRKSVRASVGGLVVAAGAGFPLGLRYVRHANYVVTSGDIAGIALSGLLGVAVAGIPMTGGDGLDEHAVAGGLTAGFLAGQFVGARMLARPYDFTRGEGALLGVGAGAGALMGAGIAILSQAESGVAATAMMTGGAIAGVVLTKNLLEPRKAGTTAPRRADRGRERGPRVSFSPTGVAQAVAGVPGRSSFLTITF